MAKINIISGSQLCNNPRVVKEAEALSEAGHEVEVFSSVLKAEEIGLEMALHQEKNWKLTPVLDNSIQSIRQRLRWICVRVRCRMWKEIYSASGWGNVRQLGYVAPEMLQLCRQRKADLNIVHNEQALWVGKQLLNDGQRVAVDLEDWYSEDLLPEDNRTRPGYLLRRWEKRLLCDACYTTTTSNAMGQALSKAYDCATPRVLYNTFPCKDRHSIDGKVIDREDHETPSIIWFSQTVGPDRGLEVLVDALPHIEIPIQIHIRGRCRKGYEESLRSRIAAHSRHQIFFHSSIPHHQLLSRLAEHDIGFAGEISYCLNKDLTISNKLFQYLLAGLVVLASDTSGQKEIASAHPNLLHIFKGRSAISLANTLNKLLTNNDHIRSAKQDAVNLAETKFCWEKSKNVLLSSVTEALSC